jgi:hypothetical protein
VSAEFDRDFNEDEYEQKIRGLVSQIEARDEAEGSPDLDAWDSAMEKLSSGDHYLSVLAGETQASRKRPPLWRRVLAILSVLAYLALWQWSREWFRLH